MTDPIRPHPKNADGPFYVEHGCCTSCDVPMQEAPGHFAYDAENHCYVCRQPETGDQTTALIGTAWMAELQCIRYRGDDADVLRRFAELDLRALCDNSPPSHIEPAIRNHVKFSTSANLTITTPSQLAQHFVDHLIAQNSEWRQFKTRAMRHRADSAAMEFSWTPDDFHAVAFTKLPRPENDEWHVTHKLRGELSDHGVGNILSNWFDSYSDVFSEMQWYTELAWHQSEPGQRTRF